MEEKLRNELSIKLEKEFSLYKKELSNKTKDKIINKSYETAIKQEISSLFFPEDEKFDIDELKVLNKEKNLLDTLYDGWMDCDVNISEFLEENVNETINDIMVDFKQRHKNKSQER